MKNRLKSEVFGTRSREKIQMLWLEEKKNVILKRRRAKHRIQTAP